MAEFLEESEYEITEKSEGIIEITAPYQTGRIIVYDRDGLDSDYGAETILYNETFDEYVLQDVVHYRRCGAGLPCSRMRASGC